MTPVAGIRNSTVAAAGRTRDGAAPHEAATASGRALIALQPIARSAPQTNSRPQAGFLAHLIATANQLPQTRERRRGTPEDASAVYAAANKAPVTPAGRLIIRNT